MRITKARGCPRAVTYMSILLAVTLAATGCTPKAAPVETPSVVGPQVSMMVETNFTASEYDAGSLILWNIGQNTLQISGTSVVHVSDFNNGGPLSWQPGSPVRIVQQWGIPSKKPLIRTTSKDVNLLVPSQGIRSILTEEGGPIQRWYVSDENAFVSVLEQESPSSNETSGTKTITLIERGVASGSKDQTLTVPVPSGLAQPDVVYGSGSITNGFVLVETRDEAVKNAADFLWLLRINNGTGSWVRCGDLSAFNGNIIYDQDASFARVGSLLYFTHGHTKIGCIDTAAASPSITLPENINTLLAKLWNTSPKGAEGPIQAELYSDNGVLIIGYPNADWNWSCYAVDASGTILGHLEVTKTSIVSFDAKGKQGSSIPISGSISFPSPDLFQ